MKYNELTLKKFTQGSRVGRGISAGQGKTAGRGTKGQKARTGKKLKPGFEGGQTKLVRRLPKLRGFTHAPKTLYQLVHLGDLVELKVKTITAARLEKAGLIKNADKPVKLLGSAAIDTALTITVDAASTPATKAVEAAGGTVTATQTPTRPQPKAKHLKAAAEKK